MSRLAALRAGGFDVAIIGGGIIGAGIARDLAMRGVSVALLEQRDFGSGTTSGSTRLIHGGLRYLEMLDFRLVRMDLREREILLRIAPHLVKPMEFRIPFVGTSRYFREKMRAGLMLYDVLSFDKTLPNHRFLSAAEALADEPSLARGALQGAGSYFDAQVRMPERLCLENVIDAVARGAVARNYCRVIRAKPGIMLVRDEDSGDEAEIAAKVIVNATGAWFDRVRGGVMGESSARIRTTKGIHLVCGEMVRKANVLFSPLDRRLFFVIPLLGKTWIGTTDTDFDGDPGAVTASEEDIAYLVRSVEPFFPSVRGLPLYSTNAGVRALVRAGGTASKVSRMHRIEETQPGVVSILGGKITGYRLIAQQASDAVCHLLNRRAACRTAEEALPGGGARPDGELGDLYGSRAGLLTPLAAQHGWVGAQALLAVREEFCRHLDDFLLRRTAHAFDEDLGGRVAPEVMAALAAELDWGPERKQEEWDRYRAAVGRAKSAAPAER